MIIEWSAESADQEEVEQRESDSRGVTHPGRIFLLSRSSSQT